METLSSKELNKISSGNPGAFSNILSDSAGLSGNYFLTCTRMYLFRDTKPVE